MQLRLALSYITPGRLAERFGAATSLTDVLASLAADCPARGIKRHKGSYQVCGAMLPDLTSPTPPDVPPAVARLGGLRIVGDRD